MWHMLHFIILSTNTYFIFTQLWRCEDSLNFKNHKKTTIFQILESFTKISMLLFFD